MTSSGSSDCTDCHCRLSMFKPGKPCPGSCGKKAVCPSCLSYACVAPEDAAIKPLKITAYCKECFKGKSSLDFGATEDIFGPAVGEAPTLVYVHGAGGSRTMFRAHARAMASKGYRCVLLDLPGHGSRMDDHLTVDSAIDTIAQTVRVHALPYRGVGPALIGGSLGGYLGMEFLGRHPDLVSSAVLLMCSQNTGVGRGIAASLGLLALDNVVPLLGPVVMLKAMVGEAKKNGHISEADLLEIALRPGMFFHQGRQHVEILRTSNPRTALPRFSGPILFVNGSKDHRDSEQVWVSVSARAKALLYEGGDHFFSHDSRFADRLVTDTANFLEQQVFPTKA